MAATSAFEPKWCVYLKWKRRKPAGRRPGISFGCAFRIPGAEFLRRFCRAFSNRSSPACNADEALKIWSADAAKIELLFTDMIMPGSLNGRKLAKKLIEAKRELKVILSSGYDPEKAGQILNGGEGAFLQKPYTLAKMAETIRRVLDEE